MKGSSTVGDLTYVWSKWSLVNNQHRELSHKYSRPGLRLRRPSNVRNGGGPRRQSSLRGLSYHPKEPISLQTSMAHRAAFYALTFRLETVRTFIGHLILSDLSIFSASTNLHVHITRCPLPSACRSFDKVSCTTKVLEHFCGWGGRLLQTSQAAMLRLRWIWTLRLGVYK